MTMDMQAYRDGRSKATEAAEAVREALAGLGFPESVWGSVRPMVTRSGKPYVHLGMVRADVAEKIAEAMRASSSAKLPLESLDAGTAHAHPFIAPDPH
ncbi:hypothetical protein [Streptomyces koelreuteriae]|uniref:hypothetical protein n=1 Tax=Streptomyces koelreuteriae TaxID=2838015 RepID=UPI003EB9BA05